MEIGIGILAGGKSKRMGKDKANLIYNDDTFINNLVKQFKNKKIIISSNKDYKIKGVSFVEDKYKDIGPISGILEILKKSEFKYNFIIAVDMQNINKEYFNYLKEYISSDYKVFSAKFDENLNPLGAIYSKEMIPVLEKAISDKNYRLTNLINNSYSKVIDLKLSKFDKKILDNINTRSDYNKLLKNNVISICGRKNSGKTTFICKVIENLTKKGYKVVAIKHDGHDFKIDNNTDTGKYLESGANSVGIFSDYKYMTINQDNIDINSLISKFKNYDLLIIEGLKNSEFDKFEIVRRENSSNVICRKELRGIISNVSGLRTKYKNSFDIEEVESFSEYIISNYIDI